MRGIRKGVTRKVFSVVLTAAMVTGLGGVPAFADDMGNTNSGTQGYTYTAPTQPMNVGQNIITATAHRAASPILGIMGVNATSGFGMINGSAPTTLAEAETKAALGIWGTSLNESPDPYYWNYFYNFYAAENGLETTDDALINESRQASPTSADTTLMEEFGNVSVSLSTRPEVVVGIGGDGYGSQLDTIHSFTPDSEFYQEGDENYNPKLVEYDSTTLTTMISSMKGLATAIDEVSAETGKSARYGDAMTIANDYEKYIYGTQAYILSKIADGTVKEKKVALINSIQEDGTYLLSYNESRSSTSNTRIVEYTNNVTENIADSLSEISETSSGQSTSKYKVATAEDVAKADVIICLDNNNTQLTEQGIKDALGSNYNGQMLITSSFTTLYGITMNSVENAVGMGYIIGCIYSDVLDVNPIEWYAYFAQRFYHITDLDSLQTVVKTNFSNTTLPQGVTAELPSDYSMAKVENQIIAGMRYYEANTSAFGNLAIPTDWVINWNNGIGAGQQGEPPVDNPPVDNPPAATQKSQKITVNTVKFTVKQSELKNGAQTIALKKQVSAQTGLSFEAVKNYKASKFLSVNANGKLKVKKTATKGAQKIKVKITAKETKKYKAATKNQIFTVTVK